MILSKNAGHNDALLLKGVLVDRVEEVTYLGTSENDNSVKIR